MLNMCLRPKHSSQLVTIISRLADDDALEYGHEILNVDEGVLSSVNLKRLQGFHYQLPEVFPSLLTVVDSVSEVVWEQRNR